MEAVGGQVVSTSPADPYCHHLRTLHRGGGEAANESIAFLNSDEVWSVEFPSPSVSPRAAITITVTDKGWGVQEYSSGNFLIKEPSTRPTIVSRDRSLLLLLISRRRRERVRGGQKNAPQFWLGVKMKASRGARVTFSV